MNNITKSSPKNHYKIFIACMNVVEGFPKNRKTLYSGFRESLLMVDASLDKISNI